MYNDKTTSRERILKSSKSSAVHKALMSKIDKNYAKQGNKEAHKRIKREGVDFNKI
jgi:hypothetical protein